MASFLEIVDRTRALLQERGRISLRALRREFSLEEEALEDLAAELADLGVATRDGNALVLPAGATTVPQPSVPAPAPVLPSAPPAPSPPARPEAAPTPGAYTPEGGERRQLTVMFCDLVGSTELAQHLDPEELSEVLRAYRAVCTEATKRFDGHVAQYLGDGVMVYFGYPRAHEDDAVRAIRTGIEIQHLLAQRSGAKRIDARIGIHTGLVVVDPSAKGDEALALGSTTNLAARIEGVAEPGTVVASEATLALCRGLFVTQSLGEVALKGIDEPVLLHRVERSAGVTAPRAEATASKPMVGRDRELGLLMDRWDEVQDGRGQVVLVSAEAGMGKSRLVQALRDALGDARHLWLDIRCSSFTSGSAFQPLVDLFTSGIRQGRPDSPEDSTRVLVSGLEQLPGLPREKVIPYLLALLSLPPSERYPLPQTGADEQRERTFAALLQLMLNLSEQQPLVIVGEDLQWADPSTLEYFARVVQQAATTRALVVLTHRPDYQPPWRQSHVTELKIARLSKRLTRELIASRVSGRLPEPVLAELETRSDGVPLFVEELASSVMSSGVLGQKGGRYELTGSLKDLAIPATLKDSLTARLDRLSASKHVAQQAATLGREFSYELIEAVTTLEPPALRAGLEQLVAAEILYSRGTPPDSSYTFKHALLQDAAYESQLLSNRKALHARIAAVLEERFPKRVAAEPEAMARHCAAAGAVAKAVDYYQRAAEVAVARLSNQEATQHFRAALATLEELPESDERHQREIALRLGHGKSLIALKGYLAKDVTQTYARVESLVQRLDEGPLRLPGLLGLVRAAMERGDMVRTGPQAEALLRIAERLGVPQLVAAAEYMVGGCHMLAASALDAEASMSRALEIAETTEFPPPATPYDLDLPSMIPCSLSLVVAQCARPETARQLLRASRERAKAFGNDFTRVSVAAQEALCAYLMFDPELARSAAAEAIEEVAGRGFHGPEMVATILHGWGRASLGEVDEGVQDVGRGLAIAEASGSQNALSLLYVASAHVYRLAQMRERAEELLDRAAARAERNGEGGIQIQIRFARAMLDLELGSGDAAEAEALLLEAIELAGRQGRLNWELALGTKLAELAPRTGKLREAHDRLVGHYARLTEGLERDTARAAKAAIERLAAQLAPS